jgi:hypothetical protein
VVTVPPTNLQIVTRIPGWMPSMDVIRGTDWSEVFRRNPVYFYIKLHKLFL